ncbi:MULTISPECIES: hypothetical protein [Paenibacillus]|uniref:hypothetical protein n=1 Tax=Paenibacillus TaxID=44249 RepID=UPI00096F2AAA|nr:hypothetical protein [Paenibacillus odorifer]OME18737.1 hypothetical protein BSK60_01470 [Paenibacillus odorifer]OME62267.1 hypothetical protein BSK59_02010 [Paenibacillus odorifer]
MSDQEREIRVNLLDGSEVIMNTGDRVLFQASSPGAIPLSVDTDTIIDDVLAALEESQSKLNEREWMLKESLDITTRLEGRLEESQQQLKLERERTDYWGEKEAEAQQTIARQREALESARSTMEDALSVGEARYKDYDTMLCPWADLLDGVANIESVLEEGETQP